MRVLLNVDSLRPPLTGIGRYTARLLEGLLGRDDVEAVHCFAGHRFVDARAALAGSRAPSPSGPSGPSGAGTRPADRLRAVARSLPGAYALRAAVSDLVLRRRTAAIAGAVYHDPNFVLRPYPGPSVATIHDLSFVHHPEFHPRERVEFLKRRLPETIARADRLLTDCEFVRRELIDAYSVDPARVHAIGLGVEPSFRPREADAIAATLAPLGLRAGGYLLSVATFEPRKNLARLVRAYLTLPRTLRDAHPLVLAGAPGWSNSEAARLVADAQRDGSVRRLGYLDEDALTHVYSGAALFAFPSVYEGFGLPILEAMASGVPVVTADRSSMPEIAGGAALLVDPTDEASIARGLQRGLEDAAWRERARSDGLRRAGDYRWDDCVARTVAAYREAAAR